MVEAKTILRGVNGYSLNLKRENHDHFTIRLMKAPTSGSFQQLFEESKTMYFGEPEKFEEEIRSKLKGKRILKHETLIQLFQRINEQQLELYFVED